MSKYAVESPHTPEKCLQALDEVREKGEDTLKKFAFGCKSGENTDWVYIDSYIDANSKKEALETVPEFLRNKVGAQEVGRFTPEEIRAAHEEA
ncbi:MAG: hypothetical protein OIN83_01090 [Candidatus Methanoperedens sp.]|nr:hypothetical protein [Candidatus Methanoperedens sp.]